jgi:hypothetical protein
MTDSTIQTLDTKISDCETQDSCIPAVNILGGDKLVPYSDLKLVYKAHESDDEDSTVLYHVHKVLLVRRSKFFEVVLAALGLEDHSLQLPEKLPFTAYTLLTYLNCVYGELDLILDQLERCSSPEEFVRLQRLPGKSTVEIDGQNISIESISADGGLRVRTTEGILNRVMADASISLAESHWDICIRDVDYIDFVDLLNVSTYFGDLYLQTKCSTILLKYLNCNISARIPLQIIIGISGQHPAVREACIQKLSTMLLHNFDDLLQQLSKGDLIAIMKIMK